MQQHSEAHCGAKFEAKSGATPLMKWVFPLQVGMGCLVAASVWSSPSLTVAQIISDQTLGGEPSIVVPNQVINGVPSDRIDGGAMRGVNLFHSLQEFNIETGRGAYFANPTGIENILTRVTGGNPSDVLGTLGVLGNANLFLINPNGIFFGPHARLDIAGSFTASTANAFKFPDGSEFSATNPQTPPLLTINITPGLQYGSSSSPNSFLPGGEKGAADILSSPGLGEGQGVRATITNRGILTTGNNLTLAAHNLDLQGELWAGGNLTLTALDTVIIRDRPEAPFVAVAGGNLLVQGNQSVDIFALNHQDSGFYSSGNMTFRSANPVGGDAHYWAGGNFQIERLDGSLGKLHSPYDPIIVTQGNVRLDSYVGTSLHIIAGGSVEITGPITITGADASGNGNTVNPANPDPFFSGLATVTLPDGTTTRTIDGSIQPVLDIRAGIACPDATCIPQRLIGTNFVSGVGTFLGLNDAVITIAGGIQIDAPNGLVYLTNRTNPNPALPIGHNNTVNVGVIRTNGSAAGNAGDIIIDAIGNLAVGAPELDTSSTTGNGGNITLFAQGNINVGNLNTSATNGQAGLIRVLSTGGTIDTTLGLLNASSIDGEGGQISLDALGNIDTGDLVTSSGDSIDPFTNAKAGNISLISRNGAIDTTAGLLNASSSNGVGGSVELEAFGDITTGNVATFSTNTNAGDVSLVSRIGTIDTTSGVLDAQSTNGDGGDITLQAQLNVLTANLIAQSEDATGGTISLRSIAGNIDTTAGQLVIESTDGNAGAITLDAFTSINTNNLLGTSINGNGGVITVISRTDAIDTTGITIDVSSSQGNGGSIRLETQTNGNITTGNLSSFTSEGDAGTITLLSNGNIDTSGGLVDSRSTRGTGGAISFTAEADIKTGNLLASSTEGDGGGIRLNSRQSEIDTQGFTLQSTSGLGDGGNVTLTAQGNITTGAIETISTQARSGDVSITSKVGTINITANSLDTSSPAGDGGNISLIAQGGGLQVPTNLNASGQVGGSIMLTSGQPMLLQNALVRSSSSTATPGVTGGYITIDASSLRLTNSAVEVTTNGAAQGGNLIVNAPNITLNGINPLRGAGGFLSQTGGSGSAGNIEVSTSQLTIQNEAKIDAVTTLGSTGQGGNIIVSNAQDITLTSLGQISAITSGDGNGGNVTLNATNSVTLDRGFVFVSTDRQPNTGDAGSLTLNTSTLTVQNSGFISTSTQSFGEGGDITVNASQVNIQTGGQIASQSQATPGFVDSVGNAGTINLNAAISVKITGTHGNLANPIGSGLLAQASGNGDAGNIRVNTPQLNVETGGRISANTSSGSSGNAGTLTVRGFDGSSPATLVSVSGAQNGTPSQLSFDTAGSGNAGRIDVATQQFQVLDGAEVSGTTSSSGQGGQILVNADGEIEIRSSSLKFDSNSSGDAQGITLNTNQLTVNGGLLSINGNSTGSPGDIDINATTGNLSNQASLTAKTVTSSGGNIRFQGDALTLNASELSTSTENGQGGTISITANDTVDLLGNSTIASQATGTGDAGAVTITTAKLSSDNSTVSTSVVDGTGGTIAITANDTVDLLGNSTIASQATGTGDAGAVTITTATLSSDNSTVSTSVVDGIGGTITTTATTATNFTNNSQFTSEATGNSGTAGAIQLTTPDLAATNSQVTVSAAGNSTAGELNFNASKIALTQSKFTAETVTGTSGDIRFQSLQTLSLNNNSEISTSTKDGQGGNLPISATEAITLSDQSQIAARATGAGSGGAVSVTAPSVIIKDGAGITTTAVNGQGGSIWVDAPQTLQLARDVRITTEASGSGTAGDIRLQTRAPFNPIDNVQITVSNTGTGNAGNLEVAAPEVKLDRNTQLQAITNSGQGGTISFPGLTTFSMDNGSVISTATQDGAGGSILVNAPNQLRLDNGARITSSATGNGNSGNIQLRTDAPLTIANGAEVTVSSQGTGQGGNLDITANALTMTTNTLLGATTASGEGGNIRIQVQNDIDLRFNSDIRTDAQGTGNGGNITLFARFIQAILSEDSDVLGGSVTGTGGRIEATALGITGFRLQKVDTPESDFTASSQQGTDGTVVLNIFNPAPEPLPDDFAQPPIPNLCQVSSGERSSFRQMGSGGVPPLPGNALSPNTVRVNLVQPVPNHAASQVLSPQSIRAADPAAPLDRIVEAQGWVKLADGTIVLTANPALIAAYNRSGLLILTCGG